MTLGIGLMVSIFASYSQACTVFCDSLGDQVLVGKNQDDQYLSLSKMWFVPAMPGSYGRVCFGWWSFAQGGMNDQGLFIDGAVTPEAGKPESGKPSLQGNLAERVLANCASVEQAVALFQKYTYTGNSGHFLIADKSGNSVICEWVDGEFKPVRKTGRYQLITNFLLSDPQLGNYPCQRQMAASAILDGAKAPSIETCVAALKAAAQDGGDQAGTKYSLVYDLVRRETYIYYMRNFERCIKIDLAGELQKGLHEVDLKVLFAKGSAYLVVPKISRDTRLSARAVLRKAIEARGGTAAAQRIHSFRAVGRLDCGWNSEGQSEILASRPDKLLAISVLRGISETYEGFNGRIAWNGRPGRVVQVRDAQTFGDRRDVAEFFAWYDDPRNYRSLENTGLKWFEGKECYELKLLRKSGTQTTHYYDATDYLLAGITETIPTQTGPTWSKTTFANYRKFGGFQFPSRIHMQSEGRDLLFEIGSVELNKVEDSAFDKPEDLPPQHPFYKEHIAVRLDPKISDAYLGVYKLAAGMYLTISRDGDRFLAQRSGQSDLEIQPESETNFLYTTVDGQLTFLRDDQGMVTGLVVHQNGTDQQAAKIAISTDSRIYDGLVGQYLFGTNFIGTNIVKPGTVAIISRKGNVLTSSVGSSSGEILPESETNFFGRKSGTEYTFVRRADHEVSHLIFHSNIGVLATLTKISDSKEPPAIELDPRTFHIYVGRYEFAPDDYVTISDVGGKLIAQWPGSSAEMIPLSETNFFLPKFKAELTFVKNDKSEVTKLILHENGLNPEAKKLNGPVE